VVEIFVRVEYPFLRLVQCVDGGPQYQAPFSSMVSNQPGHVGDSIHCPAEVLDLWLVPEEENYSDLSVNIASSLIPGRKQASDNNITATSDKDRYNRQIRQPTNKYTSTTLISYLSSNSNLFSTGQDIY
jgi:hypothetical protein